MANIYSQAEQVIVWLGEGDQESELAFQLIDSIRQSIGTYAQKQSAQKAPMENTLGGDAPPLRTPSHAPEWIAYRSLLCRPWFTRVWIFQEITLSRKAAIICGDKSVSFGLFSMVYGVILSWDHTFLPGHERHLINDTKITKSMFMAHSMISKNIPSQIRGH
jgi:hypothetical protein